MSIMDKLIAERYELEGMTNISNMREYADRWAALAGKFADCGAVYNNQQCFAKYLHYNYLVDAEYVRLQQTGYVELIPVYDAGHVYEIPSELIYVPFAAEK